MSHINFPTPLGHQQNHSQLKGRAEMAEASLLWDRLSLIPMKWGKLRLKVISEPES
jgi:hypothetical protein